MCPLNIIKNTVYMPYARSKIRRRANTKSRYSTRRKTPRYARKSRYQRPSNFRKTLQLRPKWFNPYTQKQLVKFTYADTNFTRTLTAINGYISAYLFRGGSVYDPDYTGVGVQPYGFDEFVSATMFTNFNVRSSSIRVYFRPSGEFTTMRRLHCLLFPSRTSSLTLTDPSDLRMIPACKETCYDGNTESTKGAKLKNYYSLRKIYSEANPAEFSFSGTYLANPSVNWFWFVLFYTEEYDDETIPINFDVKIRYYTVLSRGLEPNES